MIRRIRLKDLLFWLAVAEFVAWVLCVLAIPSLFRVFTGTPQYWLSWDDGRMITLFLFGGGLLIQLAIQAMIRDF